VNGYYHGINLQEFPQKISQNVSKVIFNNRLVLIANGSGWVINSKPSGGGRAGMVFCPFRGRKSKPEAGVAVSSPGKPTTILN